MAEPSPAKRRVPLWVYPAILFVAVYGVYRLTTASYGLDGPAMEPTYRDGDSALVLRAWLAGAPEPGEIIIARSELDDLEIAKRVIATAGQTVDRQHQREHEGQTHQIIQVAAGPGGQASATLGTSDPHEQARQQGQQPPAPGQDQEETSHLRGTAP